MKNSIKEIREKRGLTRKELAEKTGISYKRLGDYETNYYKTENITVGTLLKISKSLDCTIESLISEE